MKIASLQPSIELTSQIHYQQSKETLSCLTGY